MAHATLLAATDLSLSLGGRRVVDGVTLACRGGELCAVVGPNGAGKSSLLTLLAGLREVASGQVLLQDRPLADWPAMQRAQRLAWLAQQGEAEGEMGVRDVVRLGRLPRHGLFGAPDAGDEAAVDQALAETECSALQERRLSELSGGERQRVLLSRVLAVQARVLLLDEPMSHLDAPHQRTLMRSLRTQAAAGCAVVVVLHDLSWALSADRVVVMQAGRVVADAAPADAALRAALVEVFDGAFSIEAVAVDGVLRWVALPRA